jgi:hypothetical protein
VALAKTLTQRFFGFAHWPPPTFQTPVASVAPSATMSKSGQPPDLKKQVSLLALSVLFCFSCFSSSCKVGASFYVFHEGDIGAFSLLSHLK